MLVSLNASLEPYNGSRSQKSHNNIRRMLSVVWYILKDILIGLMGGFEKHCTRAFSFRHGGRSDKTQCRGGKSGRC